MISELAQSWQTFGKDEHLPLHEYMMALSIRMVSSTQFGAYFQKPENIKTVAVLYHELMKGGDDLLNGKLSPKEKEKYKSFEAQCEKFKDELRKMVKSHEKNGSQCEAPLLNTLIQSDDEEQVLGDVITLFVGKVIYIINCATF